MSGSSYHQPSDPSDYKRNTLARVYSVILGWPDPHDKKIEFTDVDTGQYGPSGSAVRPKRIDAA